MPWCAGAAAPLRPHFDSQRVPTCPTRSPKEGFTTSEARQDGKSFKAVSNARVALDEIDQLVYLAEREPGYRVGAAVVDRDPPCRRVGQRRAREDHVRDVADAL